MEKQGDEIHVSETEASGGSKEGVVRYVLIIGTFLAIAFLTLIWVTGALTQGDDEEHVSVSREIVEERSGDDTDSIVSEDADRIDGAAEEDRDTGAMQTIEN